jgi:hypothetical protein
MDGGVAGEDGLTEEEGGGDEGLVAAHPNCMQVKDTHTV